MYREKNSTVGILKVGEYLADHVILNILVTPRILYDLLTVKRMTYT